MMAKCANMPKANQFVFLLLCKVTNGLICVARQNPEDQTAGVIAQIIALVGGAICPILNCCFSLAARSYQLRLSLWGYSEGGNAICCDRD